MLGGNLSRSNNSCHNSMANRLNGSKSAGLLVLLFTTELSCLYSCNPFPFMASSTDLQDDCTRTCNDKLLSTDEHSAQLPVYTMAPIRIPAPAVNLPSHAQSVSTKLSSASGRDASATGVVRRGR